MAYAIYSKQLAYNCLLYVAEDLTGSEEILKTPQGTISKSALKAGSVGVGL